MVTCTAPWKCTLTESNGIIRHRCSELFGDELRRSLPSPQARLVPAVLFAPKVEERRRHKASSLNVQRTALRCCEATTTAFA